MKILLLSFTVCLFICGYAHAQKNKPVTVPLSAEKWQFAPEKVEFETVDGMPVMKVLPGSGKVVLKEMDFSTGVIEFDVKPNDNVFAFMHFRYKDANETESFYFRTARQGSPYAKDAVQYTPIVSGVNLWNILGHYETNASFKKQEWNHVKLEISQSQLRLYVNSDARPTLEVPRLEGNTSQGTIAFDGAQSIANLMVKHGDVNGLSHSPGFDPTDYDPFYLRHWMVNKPITTPEKVDFSYEFMPTENTEWENIDAEGRGLVNLTRKFGMSESRRLVWLKMTLKSEKAQTRNIALGFSNEVWVFLNGRMVHLDKNPYNQPMMKKPSGRISPENTSFDLNLIEGYNELLIGVANDFFGWGIIARIDKLEGIEPLRENSTYYFGRKVAKVDGALLEKLAGGYKLSDGKTARLVQVGNILQFSGENLPTVEFFPESESRFFAKDIDVQLEIVTDEHSAVSKVNILENGSVVLVMEAAEEQ